MQKADIEDVYQLSPLQQGMLFHHLYHSGDDPYVVQFHLTLSGPLSHRLLEEAWSRVLAQHPVLRTSFHWDKLQAPSQVVHRRVKLPLDLHDGRPLADFLAEDRARGFDLSQPPLMRLSALRNGPSEHVLVWTHHHLLLDGWSVALVVGQVLTLYEALVRGESRELERARPFRDYISWLRRQDLADAERFWRQELAGLTAPTPLGSREPLAGRTGPGEIAARLPLAATASLQALARENQLTVNTLVQGAWALLLSRHSGEEDVLFGTTVSGRPASLPGVESMVGLFINTLPLRVTALPDSPLLSWLRQLQDHQATLRQYEHSPLVEVQGWSGVPRGAALFHSLFVFENFPTAAERRAGPSSVEIRDGRMLQPSGYPLTLAVTPGAELALKVSYDRSRLGETEVARLLEHLRTLLESFAADPLRPLSGFEMLTPAERHQALLEWNDTAIDLPTRQVHALFEEWAERTPEAPALTWGGQTLSYRELDRRADLFARRLRGLGVGPESIVALLAERSPELIVGMLATLKAGGAYLPLDPAHPRERLALVLAEARPAVVLTLPSHTGLLPEGIALTVFLESFLEPAPGTAAADVQRTLTADTGGEGLVNVIYTSGSTGRPKGVAVRHEGIARLVRPGGAAAVAMGPREVWLQLSTLAFDVSSLEIWGPLANGGHLVLFPAALPALEEIAAAVRQHGVTSLWLTAGLFHQMVEGGLEDLSPLHQLLAGGDVLSAPHVEEALRQLPGTRLINGYGPTENTVFTSYHAAAAPVGSTVPIGRPIPGTRVHLLDAHLRPVPVGAPGRLFTGGPGLARGYLRRPELTAERYLPDPFADLQGEPGSRLYDTGDLARWRPDGVLEFLGRTDAQVKIRGFRVEPGEVEAVLARHPAVREVTVVARGDGSGRSLAAYVVLSREASPAELQGWLRERLPEPMVPSAFVRLDALPLTANGKVDRRALPAPDLGHQEESLARPRLPTEEVLEGIWGEVLGRERIGIDEDFFQLGGHSLSAIQAVSRIRKILGVELPLRALFEAPTLAALARRIETLRRTRGASPEPPLIPVPRSGDLPLSFPQQRLWFLDRLEPHRPAYNIPLSLRLRGELRPAALEGALAALVARHEALRTTFPETAEPMQRISASVSTGLGSRVDLEGLPPDRREAEARRLAKEEALFPFDLARGPLLRSRLLRLGASDHVLLLTLHHIVSDGWSMGVLVRDMLELYRSAVTGGAPVLPELQIQYADYAVWQRQWLQGEALETRLAMWRDRLAGAPPLLSLPADRPHPPVRSGRGAGVPLDLSAELSARIRALGRRHGATLHMTWLGALTALLHRYGCGVDLSVGTTVANRNRQELEDLIGFFVNTLVLRVDASEDPTAAELLKRARETALAAYAGQDIPFEKLVEELQPERNLAHTPLFQVLLALQNAPAPPIALPDLRVTPFRQGIETARFDLSLTVLDTEPELSGSLAYATDLFDAATARRMSRHLALLLDGMAESPALRLSELPLLAEAELAQLLDEWSLGPGLSATSGSSSLHELFELQAERTPDRPAVRFLDQALTFRELDVHASHLARLLRRRGVGPEVPVALFLERSTDLLVAVMGVLKAGGAFVPLDPRTPPRRVELILEDCGAPILLTQASLLPLVPAAWNGETLCLDRDLEVTARSGEDLPPPRIFPSNLCYVIYTSGSTGRPKGVLIQHGSVMNLAMALRQTVHAGLPGGLRVAMNAPLSFDGSIKQLIQILFGDCLTLLPDELRLEPEALLSHLDAQAVDTLDCTPSQLRLVLAEGAQRLMAAPFSILIGGEALDASTWTTLATDRQAACWNVYGPTECTVDTTVCRIEPGVPSIGRPLSNVRVHLLDPEMRPVPVGVVGHLHVGGAGLARGYLGQPGLTAERFLPDPFASRRGEPGARLYATGDLARWRADGRIEIRGRADDQVKIRGVRIEPREIEALLAGAPGVREAAVVVVAEPEPVLIAWVSSREKVLQEDLRDWLRDRLPVAMIPAHIGILPDPLPRTPSNKIDRLALARLAPRESAERIFVAPKGPLEKHLAELWSELLRVEHVGARDNFFALGGHSLLATRLLTRIHRDFSVEIPLRTIFETADLAALAGVLLHHLLGEAEADSQALFAEIDEMTEEEALALLAEDEE